MYGSVQVFRPPLFASGWLSITPPLDSWQWGAKTIVVCFKVSGISRPTVETVLYNDESRTLFLLPRIQRQGI